MKELSSNGNPCFFKFKTGSILFEIVSGRYKIKLTSFSEQDVYDNPEPKVIFISCKSYGELINFVNNCKSFSEVKKQLAALGIIES